MKPSQRIQVAKEEQELLLRQSGGAARWARRAHIDALTWSKGIVEDYERHVHGLLAALNDHLAHNTPETRTTLLRACEALRNLYHQEGGNTLNEPENHL